MLFVAAAVFEVVFFVVVVFVVVFFFGAAFFAGAVFDPAFFAGEAFALFEVPVGLTADVERVLDAPSSPYSRR